MSTLLRLDSISPRLAELFYKASAEQRQQAALAACLVAVSSVGLHGCDIDAAIDLLSRGGNDLEAVRRKLEALSLHFDEQYLQLSDETDHVTPEAQLLFRKSRATSALAFSLSRESGQLHEAIYEAIVAAGNRTEAMRAAEIALTAGGSQQTYDGNR